MANEEVYVFLAKLGDATFKESPAKHPLSNRRTGARNRDACPGHNYFLVGNSYNADYCLLGTQIEARRQACIALLFESRGSRNKCIRLLNAFEFEGFVEILGQAERGWLAQLPQDTYIGPAFDQLGRKIPAAFAVWQKLETEAEREPVLIIASGRQ
jgi:hypothetical protein